MCTDCGCSITDSVVAHSHGDEEHGHSHEHHKAHETLHHNPQLNDKKTIEVITKILDKNDHEAGHNRSHFDSHGVLAINLMSSPGSGKTALLEKMADLAKFKFGVIEGDLETSHDADRIKAKGIPAFQIQTGSACHLDAFMVHKGLHAMPLTDMDVCFIENVGNLICTVGFDLGEDFKVVISSVNEGDDKPLKYPPIFIKSNLVVLNKIDMLAVSNFNSNFFSRKVKELNPEVKIIKLSCLAGKGLNEWVDWVIDKS